MTVDDITGRLSPEALAMEQGDYLKLTEAAKKYRVSRNKLWLLVKGGELKAYEDPKDKRATLLRREELETFLQVKLKAGPGQDPLSD